MSDDYEGESRPMQKGERRSPPDTDSNDPRTEIKSRQGHIPVAVDAAEAALLAAGPGPIFQRSGALVHVTDRPARRCDGTIDKQAAIAAIEAAALREALAKVARFVKFDSRASDWRPVDPPAPVAEAYMARAAWSLPDLHQLLGAPTLRADGSLLSAPGYDQASGLYLVSELPGLSVPDKPSHRQAEAANEMLVDLLASFPFVPDPPGLALSVALAGIVGAVLRPTLPAAPLIGITAPAPGTGKSYYVDVAAIIATGRRAAGVATGAKAEEFEKALGAALLDGRPLLTLDNLVQPLSGQLLCMALTQEFVSVRLLGLSRNVNTPAAAAIFATANNLRIAGDMARRALICRMDAGVERPEEREFDSDLLEEAQRRRAELVGAVLTIARWGQQQRDPVPRILRAFAGFEVWARRVRDPLVRLGHANAVDALDVARGADLDIARLGAVMEAWQKVFADIPQTCAAAVKVANARDSWGELTNAELGDAMTLATGDRAGAVSARKLTYYLIRHEGRIVAGRRFRRAEQHDRLIRWQLESVPS